MNFSADCSLFPTHKDMHLHRIPTLRRESTFPALLPTHSGVMKANIPLSDYICRRWQMSVSRHCQPRQECVIVQAYGLFTAHSLQSFRIHSHCQARTSLAEASLTPRHRRMRCRGGRVGQRSRRLPKHRFPDTRILIVDKPQPPRALRLCGTV